jgi:hypothetical protein
MLLGQLVSEKARIWCKKSIALTIHNVFGGFKFEVQF